MNTETKTKLELLKNYASNKSNVWLFNQLVILEQDIAISILEAEIKQIKHTY